LQPRSSTSGAPAVPEGGGASTEDSATLGMDKARSEEVVAYDGSVPLAAAAATDSADADSHNAAATLQLRAEAGYGSDTDGHAEELPSSGCGLAADPWPAESLPTNGAEPSAVPASEPADPLPVISDVETDTRRPVESGVSYGLAGYRQSAGSSSSSSSSSGGGDSEDGHFDGLSPGKHDTSTGASVTAAATADSEAEEVAVALLDTPSDGRPDESLLEAEDAGLASSMAQLSVADAVIAAADEPAGAEQGADASGGSEGSGSAPEAALVEVDHSRAFASAAASAGDDDDDAEYAESSTLDENVLNVDSEPVEPQRRDTPAAYDTDSSWDDY
jgi:hypothetical protein